IAAVQYTRSAVRAAALPPQSKSCWGEALLVQPRARSSAGSAGAIDVAGGRQGGARLRRATTAAGGVRGGRSPPRLNNRAKPPSGESERRRAEHARPVAEPRVLDRERAPGELGRRLEDAPRDAVEELGQRLEEAAAEDEDLRIEQRHVVRDGLREVARRVGPELARELVARVRGGRDHGGVERVRVVLRQLGEARLDVGGQSVAQAPLEPAARDILLETAARAAGAWPSVGDDLGVAQLARRVARAAPELAVEHRARAHARAHEDRQQRAGPAVHAEAILAPGRGPDVVLDGDGDAEGGGERRGERDVAPAEVGRLDDGAGLRVDLAGAGDADRGEVVQAVGEGGDGAADGLEHCGGAALGLGQGFGLRGEPSVDRDGSRTNAGASEVDADDGGYAFFSSSFRAGVVSSLFASFTPFLNSFTLEPSDQLVLDRVERRGVEEQRFLHAHELARLDQELEQLVLLAAGEAGAAEGLLGARRRRRRLAELALEPIHRRLLDSAQAELVRGEPDLVAVHADGALGVERPEHVGEHALVGVGGPHAQLLA